MTRETCTILSNLILSLLEKLQWQHEVELNVHNKQARLDLRVTDWLHRQRQCCHGACVAAEKKSKSSCQMLQYSAQHYRRFARWVLPLTEWTLLTLLLTVIARITVRLRNVAVVTKHETEIQTTRRIEWVMTNTHARTHFSVNGSKAVGQNSYLFKGDKSFHVKIYSVRQLMHRLSKKQLD